MFGGIGIWQLLIILAIIVLIFGTKKMRNIGSDLGNALKGFKKAVSEDRKQEENAEARDAQFTQLDEEKIDYDSETEVVASPKAKPKTVKKASVKSAAKKTATKKSASSKSTTKKATAKVSKKAPTKSSVKKTTAKAK